jgi:hypothetical protein
MHAVGLSFTPHLARITNQVIKSSFLMFHQQVNYIILKILSKTLLVSVDDEILLFKYPNCTKYLILNRRIRNTKYAGIVKSLMN